MKQIFIFYDSTVDLEQTKVPTVIEIDNVNDGIQACIQISKHTGVTPTGFTFVDTDDTSATMSVWFNGKIVKEKGKEYIIIGDNFGTPKEENDNIFKIKI